MSKDLLRTLGEETIYSAKGHFKSSDLRRIQVTYTIWVCALLSVLGIFIEDVNIGKWISGFGFMGTMALLMWNEGKEKSYRENHKEYGEEYLSLHKKIREAYLLGSTTDDDIRKLSSKVRTLDSQKAKPDIPFLARKWSQASIKKYNETNNWFIK
tara:strand:- start:441 stop:905 length:465 start_codon:yes stop_codon:yes gene_type:complete